MMSATRVAVIIPAYNAEATLDATLRSVRAQTHKTLEIVVVDDGSRDATGDIARAHAARDARVRVITHENAGVAAARNRGIAETTAELVAPVDADDLWAADKIERQLDALARGGPQVGLVYTWFAAINAEGLITDRSYRPTEEGDVLARMCRGNLVGNASAALIRREALLEAGGYDSTLHARGAQGCEDLLLYYRIAARHRFALVPDYLTGYRVTAYNMSSDSLQMLRSWQIVAVEMRQRHPELEADIEAGEQCALGWLMRRALQTGRLRPATELSGLLMRRNRRLLARECFGATLDIARARMVGPLRRWSGRPDRQQPYQIGTPSW
jgi:glycosyltransferase involved in cell wall biosynthesis